MAAAEELSVYIKKAAGDFPLTPSTLYWRVYMAAETHLKSKTAVEAKYHANIAKFFAILWRYFFENRNIDPEKGNFNFPFEASVINEQEASDQPAKIANMMRMGDIGLKVKKIILSNPSQWNGPDLALNDNAGA